MIMILTEYLLSPYTMVPLNETRYISEPPPLPEKKAARKRKATSPVRVQEVIIDLGSEDDGGFFWTIHMEIRTYYFIVVFTSLLLYVSCSVCLTSLVDGISACYECDGLLIVCAG